MHASVWASYERILAAAESIEEALGLHPDYLDGLRDAVLDSAKDPRGHPIREDARVCAFLDAVVEGSAEAEANNA